MKMQHDQIADRPAPASAAAKASAPPEFELRVVTVYQDPLTEQWAREMWESVEYVFSEGGARFESWSLTQLKQAFAFADALEAAAQADMLVISVRGAGALPLILHGWIDAWLPERSGRPGALVALIGLPSQPEPQSDHTYQYLEAVARQAGLDFLPRERRLPNEPPVVRVPMGRQQDINFAMPLPGPAPAQGTRRSLHWKLTE